ncbi:unnamed protein product [Clonostachys byssicola]|uniref:Type 2A phosphatase-associated protein 42 n=1 Tax=Clonostachys byssicola TaxID=160290 RepID=A0A9N9YA10_9HYPO|nr:unnamed protein product [Clonostachys byssicola]
MDTSDTPQSLRALFDAAEAKRQTVESSYDGSSPTYASELEAAISLYTKTHEAIAASSLFSPNEGIEDVSTSELPFLLTSFYIAELVQKTPRLQPQERIPVLRRARLAYDAFLNLVDAYGLVKSPYDRLLERYQDDRDAFALVPNTADAAAKRNGKIASFKAEKALKEKLSILKANPRYLENGDEELVRELYLTNTLFCIHTTFTSLDYLNRELSLLSRAPPAPPTATQTDPTRPPPEVDHTLRLDQPMSQLLGRGGPLLSKEGKPLQPFTLLGSGSRQELRRGVFRPGHNLPTMSIDEYLEEERRQGNILEGGTQPKTVVDEDDMDAVDRETYKARAWDDYTDDHRKGSGNTLNMG